MEHTNTFQNLERNNQIEELTKKVSLLSEQMKYLIEGLVTALREIDEIKKVQNRNENQLIALQKLAARNQTILKDSIMINNNSQDDIDELKNKSEEISSKIDTLDFDINGIKIFKLVN